MQARNDRWRQIEPDQRYYENDGSRKEGGKASGPGNETGSKESEAAPIIPEEICPTTTVNYRILKRGDLSGRFLAGVTQRFFAGTCNPVTRQDGI